MTKEELSKFVSDDPSRLIICETWSRGEYSYATDGLVLIRLSRLEDIPQKEEAPDVDIIFPKIQSLVWFNLSEIPIDAQPICSACDGKAMDLKCPDCMGKGTYKWENKKCECEGCYGTGKVDCHKCLGTGKTLPIAIGSGHFSYLLLKKIQRLPNIKIGPTGPQDPAWLKFDGGEGLLMPMKA